MSETPLLDWSPFSVISGGQSNTGIAPSHDRMYVYARTGNAGRKGNFKARKNFVLDITSASDLSDLCFSQDCFPDNTAIIKSELATIRIAVASTLPLYML